ncbi:Uncharacterised protein [Mycobacteroides abscessus subsp. abscessus]|nr:Uncharacterised protein [Mycobacteroides abscessus subsp. abscessus]
MGPTCSADSCQPIEVRVGPGCTMDARTPVPSSSMRMVLTIASSAALAAP